LVTPTLDTLPMFVIPTLDTDIPTLDTLLFMVLARGLLMLSLRLKLMLLFCMELMDTTVSLPMLDMDTPTLDTLTLDTPTLDTPTLDTLPMAVILTLDMDTPTLVTLLILVMARGLLMLSLKLMLLFFMELMDITFTLPTPDMDTPTLDTPTSDTLPMAVILTLDTPTLDTLPILILDKKLSSI